MRKDVELLQGTLDLLILKAVWLGPLQGYAVLLRIQQLFGQRMEIQRGTLYPALYRLEHQGILRSNGRHWEITAAPSSTLSPPWAAAGVDRDHRHIMGAENAAAEKGA